MNVCSGGGLPDRLEIRMIDRIAGRRIDEDAPRPARLRPAVDLGDRTLHVSRAAQHDAAEPLRIGLAVILHPLVVGLVHGHFERHVRARGPGAEPARRQHQVHVDAFEIHVDDAGCRIAVCVGRRVLAMRAGEAGHVGFAGVIGDAGFTHATAIGARALGVGNVAGALVLVLVGLPFDELGAIGRRHIRFHHFGRRSDVRVRIENLETIPRHASLLVECQRLPPLDRWYFFSVAAEK